MQVTEVANEGLKRAFSVTVPADTVAAWRDKRLADLAKDLRLPGFRPGKVPMAVVKARYGQAVMGEVLEEQVASATRKVVEDRGLKPALQPKIELLSFAEGADLEFRLDIEVLPEIQMPDFGAIAIERLTAEPEEAEVEKAVQGLLRRRATLEDVAEPRPAEPGDVLVCDFVGRIEKDGAKEAFAGGSAKDMPIEVGGAGFIPGFTEQLAGMRPGDTRTIRVRFPEGYGAAELAGKEAEFEISAKALKRPVLPALDDALAQAYGFQDVAALKAEVRAQLQRDLDRLSRVRVKRQLLDALAAQASFTVPEGMVEAEFRQIWNRVEEDRKAGRLDPEDAGKDEDTLKAEYRAIAERRIRLGLLLSEIGRANGIQVTQEELTRALREQASRYPGREQQVFEMFRKNPDAMESLRAPIFEEKVVDFLLELAKVTERKVTPSELAEQPAAA
ncbi:MAG: trigger factor [Elioraea sp.]|nr:trigger factor [Elioraea sp.]